MVLSALLGFFLSCAILIPLGWKWCIRMRIVVPAAVGIGLLSGVISHTMLQLAHIQSWIWNIGLQLLIIAVLTASGILMRFYRDPERIPPPESAVILSPADGEVIYVKRVNDCERLSSRKNGTELPLSEEVRRRYFTGQVHVIGISMNFLDIHVNRIPVSGCVEFLQHYKGAFLSLKKREAYFRNEKVVTIIDNGIFKIGVVQIASRLVRRIVSYVKEGDNVHKGQRMGMIRFGSQVDLIIPCAEHITVNVKEGHTVKAGLSIIAHYR